MTPGLAAASNKRLSCIFFQPAWLFTKQRGFKALDLKLQFSILSVLEVLLESRW